MWDGAPFSQSRGTSFIKGINKSFLIHREKQSLKTTFFRSSSLICSHFCSPLPTKVFFKTWRLAINFILYFFQKHSDIFFWWVGSDQKCDCFWFSTSFHSTHTWNGCLCWVYPSSWQIVWCYGDHGYFFCNPLQNIKLSFLFFLTFHHLLLRQPNSAHYLNSHVMGAWSYPKRPH